MKEVSWEPGLIDYLNVHTANSQHPQEEENDSI